MTSGKSPSEPGRSSFPYRKEFSMAVIASTAYWAPVKFRFAGDNGVPETLEFRARFKRLKKSERIQLFARLEASRQRALAGAGQIALTEEQDKALPESITDAQFLDLLLIDWDLKDVNGAAIPYTSAVRAEQVEESAGLEGALVSAWFMADAAVNSAMGTEKNSAAPSATTS
jgi:plasmid replication initiation protein